MSVRTKPSREQVQAAETLYCTMREGRATHFRIQHGKVVRAGLAGNIAQLLRLPSALSWLWALPCKEPCS